MDIITSAMVQKLFYEQLNEWKPVKVSYNALKRVKSKGFVVRGCGVSVQFNPARIQSTSAKVDSKSIRERKCFLCPDNLPAEQRGLPFGNDYQVLVNPFPIFPIHFTIPSTTHTDQLIFGRYKDMLDLARCLDEFVVFYNGPKCGASAPDHVHFQAGNKGFLPIEKDVKTTAKKTIISSAMGKVYALRHYLRNVFVIESERKDWVEKNFKKIYALLDIKEGEKEPMLNIITWYEQRRWFSCIFPREVHRPRCFYAEGEDNILLSPASVDMGGVFITPQEKDFIKITGKDIEAILQEVCISDEKMEELINSLIV